MLIGIHTRICISIVLEPIRTILNPQGIHIQLTSGKQGITESAENIFAYISTVVLSMEQYIPYVLTNLDGPSLIKRKTQCNVFGQGIFRHRDVKNDLITQKHNMMMATAKEILRFVNTIIIFGKMYTRISAYLVLGPIRIIPQPPRNSHTTYLWESGIT